MAEGLININGDNVQVLQILALTTLISLLPSLLVMMTSFTRYIVSLSFLRTAMGTLLTMNPVLTQIQHDAWEPYTEQEISEEEFIERAQVPLKRFMLNNTEPSTLRMFCDLAHEDTPETDEELVEAAPGMSLRLIVPSFMTCELKKAFLTGFLLYIPFLLIDVVVSSTLMSMGMIMLPPAMIATPFKLLLFVSLNGWDLMFSSLVQSVN